MLNLDRVYICKELLWYTFMNYQCTFVNYYNLQTESTIFDRVQSILYSGSFIIFSVYVCRECFLYFLSSYSGLCHENDKIT